MFYNNTVFLILLTTNIINFWRFSYVNTVIHVMKK